MNILFRVDAGGKVGLGHYYRSVSLAKKLAVKGHNIFFIHKSSDFWNNEKSKGFPFHSFVLKANEELSELQIIKEYSIDIFYVDGIIEFEDGYMNRIKQHAKVVFYQNNSNSRHLADVFILPSLHQKKKFFDSFTAGTTIYQGLEYFTFHDKISSLKKKEELEEVKNIGIIAGGSDPRNTLKILQAMLDLKQNERINFTFFYGNDYKNLIELKIYITKFAKYSYKEFNHQEILNNDLLISAFGVSTYEFMALGMPILSYGHQEANAQAADYLANKTNALVSLGLIDNLTITKLNAELAILIKNKQRRKHLSNLAKSTLDFEGIDRIIKILENAE
jgi:spore coat polysaccharide biosynthesis predicted glycosyltransferase SpsG